MVKCTCNIIFLLDSTGDAVHNKHMGLSPVMIATMYGHHHLLYVLADWDADFTTSENGRSALHYAATLDPPEGTQIADFLIENGCEVNSSDAYQNTPLIWAINYNQLEMVKFLLEKGASIDSTVTQYGHNAILECVHVQSG